MIMWSNKFFNFDNFLRNFKREIIFDAFAYSPEANEPAKMKIEYPLTLLSEFT